MVLSFPPKGKRALLPESFRDAKSIGPENVVDFSDGRPLSSNLACHRTG